MAHTTANAIDPNAIDPTGEDRPPLMVSPPIVGVEPAIDVAHLARMTLGERSLELQVLELFDRQSEQLLARMQEVEPAGVATLAHTMVGSARGIGAWQVAAAAETVERAVRAGEPPGAAIQGLARVVGEARCEIAGLLRVSAPS